jgi:FkbM family methyltransferase
MTEINGWHLPGKDSYFREFANGAAPKRNGFQREHLLQAFKHVRKWGIAIDVGAHVGFWTLDMAERFQQVFAFEPAPDTFECLCKNMAGFPHVATARAAIGNVSGKCTLVDDPERLKAGKTGNTGSRFVQPGDDVVMLALDDLNFTGCDLLKIDVEGFEFQVLAGAKRLIGKYRPVIIMETDKGFARRFGQGKRAAEIAVREMGYKEAAHMRPDKVFIPQ